MMRRAKSVIKRELDLVKFIKRQRAQRYAIIAMLSARQRFFVDKMATMVLRESSNFDSSTETDHAMAKECEHEAIKFAARI